MKHTNKLKSLAEIQLDQLLRELETEEGRKRLGDDAYKEAMSDQKKKPPPSKIPGK